MTDTTNVQASDDVQLKHLSRSEYPPLLRVSDILRRIVGFIGTKGSWLIIPLVLITCLDITGRKLIWRDDDGGVYGLQIWLVETFGRVFESTLMQELEWHFHTGLWVLVLGYGYISNTHVRVDLVRETLHMRKKAWIEILGVTFFLIPYICIVTWFAFVYAYDSFLIGEISASQVGLSHRWIIKSIIVFWLYHGVARRLLCMAAGAIGANGAKALAIPDDDDGLAGVGRRQLRGQGTREFGQCGGRTRAAGCRRGWGQG